MTVHSVVWMIVRTFYPRLASTGKGKATMPTYDTESVWTFAFWQAQIDISNYRVDLGVGQFDLVPIMDGQPLTLMARTRDGSAVAFRFELWHERLLPAAHAAWWAGAS